jgi:hypothetical protein
MTATLERISGGWTGAELAESPELWRLPLPADVCDELLQIAGDMASGAVAGDPFQQRPVASAHTGALVSEVHRRLTGTPGFVVLTGFPVDAEPEPVAAAYWALGLLIGRPVAQHVNGILMTRVENAGRDPDLPGRQGYRLPEALPFHIDRCTDTVSLLCVRPAERGGLSRLVSCKHLHNALLARYPEQLRVLYQPLPFSVPPLQIPDGQDSPRWCEIPVFSRIGGGFAAHFMRRFFDAAQTEDDAPRLTRAQVAALDAVEDVLEEPGLAFEMALRAGDVQIINNLHVLHSRTAYHDDVPRQGRLLLRLWLAFAGSPELPAGYAPMFGATAAGTFRGGFARTADVNARFGMPLEAFAR